MREAYDYIVVGAGSSGCVVASRLSEDEQVSVLLLEAGPPDDSPFLSMPMGFGQLMGIGGTKPKTTRVAGGTRQSAGESPYIDHFLASPGGNRPDEVWMKGRTLGGSSSINGMVYVRGAPADYDGWAIAGCPGWSWEDIGSCFGAMERHELRPGHGRGDKGPLKLSVQRIDRLGRATIAAAAEAGTPTVGDVNSLEAVEQGGFGPNTRTIWRGRRFSAASAFLRPARRRRNLDVVTGAEVLGLLLEGRETRGVRVAHAGADHEVKARREVILSAGAINSPKLLQLAGIGPAAALNALGIPVLVDAPNVGRDLQEHRTVSMGFGLRRGGHNPRLRGLGLVGSVAAYYATRSGPLSTCFWEVGGWVKTRPDLPAPDCQIGVSFFTLSPEGISRAPGMTLFGYVLRPESRGDLAVVSRDPRKPPRISVNYLSTEYDRTHTAALYRSMRRIARQSSLAPFITDEIMPGPALTSDEDLVEAAFTMGACPFHISGTCRMGSDQRAVLDPALRVRGVSGLRVADTSIMPKLVSANTNAAAMVIGWRAADLIRQTPA